MAVFHVPARHGGLELFCNEEKEELDDIGMALTTCDGAQWS
jgi:hypothetical protein